MMKALGAILAVLGLGLACASSLNKPFYESDSFTISLISPVAHDDRFLSAWFLAKYKSLPVMDQLYFLMEADCQKEKVALWSFLAYKQTDRVSRDEAESELMKLEEKPLKDLFLTQLCTTNKSGQK